jgi:cell wall-associated NlpC family hydrolase
MRFHAKSALLFVLLCRVIVPAALAQESQRKTTAPRTLTRREGLAIVRAALHSRNHAGSPSDCSHLVHALYERAGFPYDYAPSSDLYSGTDEFHRVATPQPGDLAVWRGHAGIVVNPAEHSFFSVLSSGPGVDSWDSPYWKQRGRPRFFRYVKQVPTTAVSTSIRSASLKP